MTFILFFSEAHSFKCYISGSGNQILEQECPYCIGNVDCLCGKAPNFQGREERFCMANPHFVKKPGCGFMDFYQGLMTEMCLCNEELCNGSYSVVSTTKLIMICPALFLIYMCLLWIIVHYFIKRYVVDVEILFSIFYINKPENEYAKSN